MVNTSLITKIFIPFLGTTSGADYQFEDHFAKLTLFF